MERDQWEYVHIQVTSMGVKGLTEALNDAGARGWRLVSITNNDKMIGLNSIVALMTRPIEPLPEPDDLAPDWKPDPSGRFKGRYWDGEAWTFRTMTDGTAYRDPPTARTPANGGSQRHRFAPHAVSDPGLERRVGYDVDGDAEQLGQLPFESDEIEEPDAVVEVDEQVDVAGVDVVASRRTAEHPHVAGSPGLGGLDDGIAPLSEPSPERRVGQPQDTVGTGNDIDGEVMARGLDQPGQSSEAWLAASRFVRTDDRLGHARPLGELGLGQAGPFAGGSERAGGVH